MALEEQIEQYKELAFAKRLMIMACVGVCFPSYILYTDYEVLTQEIEAAQSQKNTASAKLTEAQKKKAQLPERLEELDKAKKDLAASSRQVGSVYDIDEILRNTASTARDNSVALELFKPEGAIEAGGKVKYSKQEIEMKMKGKFTSVTRFLDTLLNVGPLIYLKGIKFEQAILPETQQNSGGLDKIDSLKERTAISGSARMLVFKKITVQ